MTRSELAQRAKVSINTLKPLYDDTWKGLRRDTIDSICEILDVGVGELFERVESKERPKERERTMKNKKIR